MHTRRVLISLDPSLEQFVDPIELLFCAADPDHVFLGPVTQMELLIDMCLAALGAGMNTPP